MGKLYITIMANLSYRTRQVRYIGGTLRKIVIYGYRHTQIDCKQNNCWLLVQLACSQRILSMQSYRLHINYLIYPSWRIRQKKDYTAGIYFMKAKTLALYILKKKVVDKVINTYFIRHLLYLVHILLLPYQNCCSNNKSLLIRYKYLIFLLYIFFRKKKK